MGEKVMKQIFCEIEKLIELEKLEKWEDIRVMLLEKWNQNRKDIDIFLRLVTECWHILSLWDCCIQTCGLSEQKFRETLIEATLFGLIEFSLDIRFLTVVGYMMSVLPYLFLSSSDEDGYSEWAQKGKEMLRLAYERAPDDLLVKTLWLGTVDCEDKYAETKQQLSSMLDALFPNETIVEQYFKDILKPWGGGQ